MTDAVDNVSTLTREALAASARSDAETAIGLLKRAIEIEDRAPVPHYLLGAEYAQIGLYDRAIDEMTQAVRCDPQLAPARFQLGLLHLTGGDAASAEAVWAPLESLPESDPLRIFQRGLVAMAYDRFDDARALLEAGIAVNDSNEALNADMRKVLAAMAQAGEEQAGTLAGSEHVLLSTYRGA